MTQAFQPEKHIREAEYQRLMAYLRDRTDVESLSVEFLVRTGCRQDELVRLHRGSFHWDRGRVTIEPAKGSKRRVLPLDPGFLARLKPWIDGLRLGGVWGELLCDAALSKATHTRSVRRAFRNVLGSALGLSPDAVPYSTHSLRHTFTMRVLEQTGGDLIRTQFILGHKSLGSTARYLEYLRSDDVVDDVLSAVAG